MKKLFFDLLDKLMEENSDIYFIMAGLGYPRTQEFLDKYPNRAFNFEASEQTVLDAAVGLAYAGKIPVVYSITPFLLFRGFETIRTYINHEQLNVKLIGAGRHDDYSQHDGFSHFAGDDTIIRDVFENINCSWPSETDLEQILIEMMKSKKAWYCNLKR